jgi:hypothetical protein
MKRQLLVIAIGIASLIALTWLGTFITTYIPHPPTFQIQTAQAGPYDITLRIDPNPPSPDRPATLSIQILQHTSHQPLNNAHVTINGAMPSMGMGTTEIVAQEQSPGKYIAHMPFSMSGPWQIQVLISLPGQPVLSAVFMVVTR